MFTSLKYLKWQYILLLIFAEMVSFLINGFLDQSMIGKFGKKVSYIDCYMLAYANNFLNKILPTIGGGAAFRAIFLKKKYDFPYLQFVSTITGLYVISFFSVSLIGLVCLVLIYIRIKVLNWFLIIAFSGLFLGCLSIIIFSPKLPESNNRLVKIFNSVIDGWIMIRKDYKFIVIYTFLSIILFGLSALATMISYKALGLATDYIDMLFLSSLGIIMAFMNFTPDGIGVKEGLFIFSSDLVRIPKDMLVMGSLVLRAVSFCSTFIIGGISYLILTKKFNKLSKSISEK